VVPEAVGVDTADIAIDIEVGSEVALLEWRVLE